MNTTRRTLIDCTAALLERGGYHGTSLQDILAAAKVPRGSLYHHFPGGKEELAAAAIEDRARRAQRFIDRHFAAAPDIASAIRRLFDAAATGDAGAPFAAVALEAGAPHPRLSAACEAAYAAVRERFEDHLTMAGHRRERSEVLATLLTAAIEGVIVLRRAEGGSERLRLVGAELAALAQSPNSH
jgi:TetR/AcrR family transcriptional regulator, lmrAB and yxaGH operons repressor